MIGVYIVKKNSEEKQNQRYRHNLELANHCRSWKRLRLYPNVVSLNNFKQATLIVIFVFLTREEVRCLGYQEPTQEAIVAIQLKDDRDSDQSGTVEMELIDMVQWYIDALPPTSQYL